MSSISGISNSAMRPSDLQISSSLLSAIEQTENSLQTYQTQISTGKSVNVPSDAPQSVASILALNEQLANLTQTGTNLTNASSILNTIDQALTNAGSLITSAANLGLSQIGTGATASTRSAQAVVVQSDLQALIQAANGKFQNVSLFGGANNPGANQNVFSSFLGGVLYTGSDTNLTADVGTDAPLAINSNGQESFGALDAQIDGSSLDPQATAATQLSSVAGAQGQGVRAGAVVVTVDGTAETVDLSNASTLGDVVTRINNAIDSVNSSAGSLAVGGSGLTLTAASGHTIQISESAGAPTAADLGIDISATGDSTTGAAINPLLTADTTLASLGASVDWTSGLQITQGTQTAVADFSGDTTIGDVMNTISGLNLGLKLQINSAGTGLNLVDQVSGIQLSVGENGGTTAQDLGLSTMQGNTTLASLNQGQGITRVQGSPDFQIQLHNGTTFQVNLDGATTLSDVVNDITSAATNAGVTVGAPGAAGTQLNVGFATNGTGLELQDNTTGSSDFQVQDLGQSQAADGLGIVQDAGAGSTIQGSDVGAIQANNAFTDLIQLGNALTNNDSNGISIATNDLQNDAGYVTQAQALIGTRSQEVSQAQSNQSEMQLADQTLLSNLQDTNMTTAITNFTQLQNQLQGALQVGSRIMQMNLLDFLQ